MPGIVESGRVALIHYTCKDADGKVLDGNVGRDPMPYLHGHSNIVRGLEQALEGKQEGDRVQVVVAPAEGYGERTSRGAQAVPRREFPKNIDLREGMPLRLQDSEGNPVLVWVTKVQGSKVWLDSDHPLAGKELHFDVEIVRVRDALPDEVAHGHPHGPDGHGGH
jgi:FKBP-type peptidyl-prolyl cis-trans isomerase SlyD